MNLPTWIHLGWIIPLALLIGYIGSPRFSGSIASARVRRMLDSALERGQFTVRHVLEIPSGGGTLRIDHLVICRTAIFVITSLYLSGWISGSRLQDRWKRETVAGTRRFDNPVHHTELCADALSRALELPRSRFRTLVVICGHKGFRKGVPDNVVTLDGLLGRMRSASERLLSVEECDQVLLRLQQSSIRPARDPAAMRWKLARFGLLLVLIAGVAAVYGEDLRRLFATMQREADMRMDPAAFHPDGRPKSEKERWEDNLQCAVSVDTGRCACYGPQGDRADLPAARCRELAERGSILRQ